MNREEPKTEKSALPPPSFVIGDTVKLKQSALSISDSHKNIVGKTLIVKKCEFKNLGDIDVETVRFTPQNGVQNPYLAKYFEKVKL